MLLELVAHSLVGEAETLPNLCQRLSLLVQPGGGGEIVGAKMAPGPRLDAVATEKQADAGALQVVALREVGHARAGLIRSEELDNLGWL